ncbi:MAG: isoprenylcysteine carboxylmethyltransferase family protein [Gammaproteobacteria bacterium]|nr:isoprenylcysteine carboxylmethyltransferase family protein [Gammaproteobacteria bacterium]
MLALISFLALVVLISGVRIALHHARTGDHGVRLKNQFKSKSHRVALYLQLLAICLLVTTLTLNAFGIVKPHVDMGTIGALAGLCACATGTAVAMLAQYQMGNSWRIGVDDSEETELVDQGLFAVSRNPIYIGVLFVGIGFVVLVPHVTALVSWLIAAVGIHLQVTRVEEPHLHSTFGGAYSDYCERVNRYLPDFRSR